MYVWVSFQSSKQHSSFWSIEVEPTSTQVATSSTKKNAAPETSKISTPKTHRSFHEIDWGLPNILPHDSGLPITQGASTKYIETSKDQGSDAFTQAENMNFQLEGETLPFFKAIREKIERNLIFPREMSKLRIHGKVQVQFEVDPQGAFTGRLIQLDSEDETLKTFVMATLAYALKAPLPKSQQSKTPHTSFILHADFDFRLLGYGDVSQPVEVPQFKNMLFFRREARVDPILNEYIARYLPPFIPIPGGVILNLMGAYHLIMSIGKPSAQMLQRNEKQFIKDKWSQIARQSNPE